jgi:hypothetical protein
MSSVSKVEDTMPARLSRPRSSDWPPTGHRLATDWHEHTRHDLEHRWPSVCLVAC